MKIRKDAIRVDMKIRPSWTNVYGLLLRAMILTVAFLLTGEKKYKVMAQRQMDYILGENATGHSYVTGIGEKIVRIHTTYEMFFRYLGMLFIK